jgi:cell wall-associated NlpC family hydrolase
MPKKLLSLLAEEITEQGFGRYFRDAILPSGQRIGDVKSVDLSTSKPIDITISDTEDLSSDTEELPNEVKDEEDVIFQDIVKDSEKSIGTKYCYGGNDPNEGIDCSAFMLYYYKKYGIDLPRSANSQYNASKKFDNKDNLKVGDLIFFEGTQKALPDGSASHVGMVHKIHPDGKIDMIHASSSKGVIIQPNVFGKNYYKKHFLSFGTFRKGISPKKVEDNKILGGNTNLKKQKFIYPLPKKVRLASPFGPRGGRHHDGVDLACPGNTEVYSVADGKVVRADIKDYEGYGNFIIVKHILNGETLYSGYAHLTKMLVSVGDEVKQGQLIAKSGGSQGMRNGAGNSEDPHLHFEIRKSQTGGAVNPLNYIDNIK